MTADGIGAFRKTVVDADLIEYAKERLWDECIYQDDDDSEVDIRIIDGRQCPEGFEAWASNMVNRRRVPDSFSVNDIKMIFRGRLKTLYKSRLKDAQRELKDEEKSG